MGNVNRRAWCPLIVVTLSLGCSTSVTPHYRDIEKNLAARGLRDVSTGSLDATANAPLPGPSMSVTDAVKVALHRNESLRAALAGLGADVGQLIAAGSVANPTAELTTFFPVGGERAFSFEVGVLQELNDIVLRNHRRRAARAVVEEKKLELAAAIVSLAAGVRRASYDHLAAKHVLSLRKQSLEAAESSAEIAARLLAAGNASKIDVMRRQAARDEAMLAEQMATRRLVATRETLSRLLSVSAEDGTDWDVVGELPAVPPAPEAVDDLEAATEASSLTLQSGEQALVAARARRSLARASAWPHLGVGAFADIEPGDGTVGLGPAVELEIPLFNFGRGEVAAANAELDVIRHQNAQQRVDVLSAARLARASLDEAHRRARFLEEHALPRRQQLTQEMLKMYNGMYIGVFELLQAKRDELETEVMWIESVRDYWSARAQVDLVLAGGAPMIEAAPMSAGPTINRTPMSSGAH